MRNQLVLFLATLLSLACGGGSDPKPIEPKLSALQTEVFDVSCAFSACHDTRSMQAGLVLVAPSHAALLRASTEKPAKKIIEPGDPDASYLMDKLLNRDLPMSTDGTLWTSMPPGVTLEADRIEAIRKWIQMGAMND